MDPAAFKAAATKLRQERRELKITLRGLQDDALLQESFAVLRSIQRRYQPLCRTVCLSSNLTDDAIRASEVSRAAVSSNNANKKKEGGGGTKLSPAEREAILLERHTRNGGAAGSSWSAVEVEGLCRFIDSFGLSVAAKDDVPAAPNTCATGDAGARAPLAGEKRPREGEGGASSSDSLRRSFITDESVTIADRLHSSHHDGAHGARRGDRATAPYAFHDLHAYAYGTDMGLAVSGTLLRHALQRQVALWAAGAQLAEQQSSSTASSLIPQQCAAFLSALDGVRIIPFFHEATRVASFAIVVGASVASPVVRIALIDPTIEVAERHFPQLLDSIAAVHRRDTNTDKDAEEYTPCSVVVNVLLTHIPRDVQMGVAAVEQCVAGRGSEECCVAMGGPTVFYSTSAAADAVGAAALSIPIPSSSSSLVFKLVPCFGYSSDSAIVEMSLVVAAAAAPSVGANVCSSPSSVGNNSLLTVAAFLPPTVGLDGLCRLDYLTSEKLVAKYGSADGTGGGAGVSEGEAARRVAECAELATRDYHNGLLYVATRYMGYSLVAPSPAAAGGASCGSGGATTGEGLVLFASRGGYNCSNGMLEAHWATTVSDLKHQQHTRALWAAVTNGRSEARGDGKPAAAPSAAAAGDAGEAAFVSFYRYLEKQQHLVDPLNPPMPKLLNSQRNYGLNLRQLGVAVRSAPSPVAARSDNILITIDIRPVPEYLAHPTPNTANVPFLPLFTAPTVVYKPHQHVDAATARAAPAYSLPSTLPAPVQLGAKKPEQWLGSFVDMGAGDGLLVVVPDPIWAQASGGSAQPIPLTQLARKHGGSTTDGSLPFMLALRQRFEHMGLLPYAAEEGGASSASSSPRLWTIGVAAYTQWLGNLSNAISSSASAHSISIAAPFPFATKPYDHRSLRLNSCEELAVLNLPITAMQMLRDEEGYVTGIEPPDTVVIDIRTHAEFRNGSHRNSLHYAMWELLEDWRKEHTAAAPTADALTPPPPPRWVERFGTKALDAGIAAELTSNTKGPDYFPCIGLYCAGGYRSHITASLLRCVPLGLAGCGLLPNVDGEEDDNAVPVATDKPSAGAAASARGMIPRRIPTYYDVSGGAFQIMTQRPDLWHVKDRSVICVS